MKKLSIFLLIISILLASLIGCAKKADVSESLPAQNNSSSNSTFNSTNNEAKLNTPPPTIAPSTTQPPAPIDTIKAPDSTITEKLDNISAKDFFDDAVFFGDSITVGLKTYVENKRRSDKDFLGEAIFLAETSYSLSATKNKDGYYLHPLYNGHRQQPQKSLKEMRAKKVLIMMGVNDVSKKEATILRNYSTLIDIIRITMPSIKIYIISIFPMTSTHEDESRNNTKIHYLNTKLRKYAYKENIPFIDMTDSFKIKKEIDSSLYSDDFVHINSKGYEIYTEQLIKASKLFSLTSGNLGKVVNVKSSVNARKEPDKDAQIAEEILKGTLLKVEGKANDDWYKITYNNEAMYVFEDLIEYYDDQSLLGKVVNVDEDANIRDIPSTGTPPLGIINKDEYVTIIPDYYSQYWYRVFNDGQAGYIYKSLIK